jgi:hypothetical protein
MINQNKVAGLFTILLIIVLSAILLSPTKSEAQIISGNRFVHVDTLNITTTHRDTTFAESWRGFAIVVNTDAYIKIGAPDTAGWATKPFAPIFAGQTVMVDPGTPVKRIEIWTASGTGIAGLYGDKRTKQ